MGAIAPGRNVWVELSRGNGFMERIEHDGIWWDPRDPDQRWPGTVRFEPRQGTTLTIRADSEKPEPFGTLREYERIYGVASNGLPITLLHCFDRSSQGSLFTTGRKLEIFANGLITGLHCESTDPSLSLASVRLAHANEWWGQSGFEQVPDVGLPDQAVRYRTKEPTAVYKDRFQVSIRPYATGSFSAHRVLMEESIAFEIKSEKPVPLSDLEEVASACSDFLSIACATLCGIEAFTLLRPRSGDERPRLGQLYTVPHLKHRGEEGHRAMDMLFRFSDMERPETAFAAWFDKMDRLKDARTLYKVGLYGGGYIEHRLLALTQAAEAYHRRFFSGRYMDDERFKADVLVPLSAAIPSNIDASHRDAIKARLRFANEVSLRKRLQELFKAHSAALTILAPDAEKQVSAIVDMRNHFTHYPVPDSHRESKNQAGRDKSLFYLYLLRLLLEACFLTEMGFEQEKIVALVERSDEYSQMARRFRDMT